jgi:ABC-type branched-subunit amino acid transport system ATPase component
MAAPKRSKLVRIFVRNIGCIGNNGLSIDLDNVVCLVGRNNVGKSTILRAYELARGTITFDSGKDRHQGAEENQPSEIRLEVHIPEGIGNVDAKWKQDIDGLQIVKSRWLWASPNFQKVRTTWDPVGGQEGAGEWAEDGKAGGADPVFTSRLPRPIRIGSLQDTDKTEDVLLTLALDPMTKRLEQMRTNPESELAKAIASVTDEVNGLTKVHEEHFNSIAGRVSTGFKGVFPQLDVRLKVGAAPLVPKIGDLVKSGSGLRVLDGAAETALAQQGTGARRALFWAMLQVHHELSRDNEIRAEYRKTLDKDVADLQKKLPKAKEADKAAAEAALTQAKAQLAAHDGGAAIPDSPEDPSLPGYLLLIDEPENALHPMASRAAQRHLYKLAESPDWQVIMTTHSPYFINPFEDHTTIVRLERSDDAEGTPVSPRTYRSDLIDFDGDDKERLKALQNIDSSFSEVFFGSYPVLVEGDTEHAAFMASILERQHDLVNKLTIVRARGKAILTPLIKVLSHFRIDFSIVHDCDPPFNKNGDGNGMWTENGKIRDAIITARANGITVRHRISVPDFERLLGGSEESKDKPLNTYLNVSKDDDLAAIVQDLLQALFASADHDPFGGMAAPAGYMDWLKVTVSNWAQANGEQNNQRYSGKKSESAQ